MNFKRLTTDNPVGNLERMLNNVYAKDGKAIIRLTMANDDRENIDLCEYIADLVSGVYKDEYCTAQSIMDGACMECDGCPFGVLYAACVQAAELRARLKMYEDKADPQKPINKSTSGRDGDCPVCSTWCSSASNFCDECGQALDWS